MSILSDFEDSIARTVEGVFAGVFRSRVQPAEIAKALGREADRGRVVGVGKVYAPNLYTVVISPADEERLGSFTDTLAAELATYLIGYAREKGYSLEGRPVVRFRVHDALKLGRFEAIGELASAPDLAKAAEECGFFVPEDDAKPAAERDVRPRAGGEEARAALLGVPAVAPHPGPGVTVPPSAVWGLAQSASAPPPRAQTLRAFATMTVTGVEHDVVLQGDRLVIGRMPSTDIQLPDANISREHAELVSDGSGWTVADLGSTNGTFVNGELVQRAHLRDGDRITLGVSELVYHEPRG